MPSDDKQRRPQRPDPQQQGRPQPPPRDNPPPAARPGSALRPRHNVGGQPQRPDTGQHRDYGYQGSPPTNHPPPVINGRAYQPPAAPPPGGHRKPALSEVERVGGQQPRNIAVAVPRPRVGFGTILAWLLLLLLAGGGLFGLYVFTRGYSLLNGISTQRLDTNGNAVGADPNILGRDSINILLLGLDTRPGAPDGTRSDTMIVVRINPKTKAAAMLSFPRDMWVPIPGHDKNRINAAYFFGDQDKPGIGGPVLAKQTVAQLTGLPVDYYAQVDFNGFKAVVDAIGGVNIDVQKPLIDNQFPTADYGLKRLYIPAGLQHMDGATALEYARSRHADSDLGRNQRQQQVLLAIREDAANIGIVGKLDQLTGALQGTIKTDLASGELVSLVQLATGMDKNNIKQFAVDANMLTDQNIGGNQVLVPDMNAVRQLVENFKNATK